jgi:hypothetical protein
MSFIRLVHEEGGYCYLSFSMLYILVGVGEMKINVVGFLPKDDILR